MLSKNLSKTNNQELKEKLDLLNNRPRRCINYRAPNELINEYITQCFPCNYKLSYEKSIIRYFLLQTYLI